MNIEQSVEAAPTEKSVNQACDTFIEHRSSELTQRFGSGLIEPMRQIARDLFPDVI